MNNLTQRTLTAVVFVIVMVAGIVLHPIAFGALFIVVMAVAMDEFYRMTMGGRYLLQQKLAILTTAVLFTMVLCIKLYSVDIKWLAVTLLPFFAVLISAFFAGDHSDFGKIAYVLAGMCCIGLPVCAAPFLVFDATGAFNGFILLAVYVVIWLCDVGAYSVGSALGQRPGARKMAPSISPKKSWWGFGGGLALGILSAYLMHLFGWFPYSVPHCLALGLVISVASVCGDLSESMWKRWCGVKDSGTCIPGHGGMFDRFDSSLFAMPLAVVYLALFGLL